MNYQHLYYFRTVAVLGGITPAAQHLRLTPPTLSGQVRALEDAIGVALFTRTARGMVLTDAGRLALSYADRIFALGAELERQLTTESGRVLRVGVETSIVAATARPLLARLAPSPHVGRVVCSFGPHHELVASMKALELDVMLTTAPSADLVAADRESWLVIETEVAFFADAATAESLRPGFPASLDGASFIGLQRSSLRDAVDRWLVRHGVRLTTNIELDDASIAAALAADGVGIVAAPLSACTELGKRYDLAILGVAEGVRAQIHAVGSRAVVEELLPALRGDAAVGCGAERNERHA